MKMVIDNSVIPDWSRRFNDYLELAKPKVVALITFTAMVGMLLAVPGMVPVEIFVFGSLGIALSAGSAAAVNHLLERRSDALMTRTRRRPLPSGQLATGQVLGFAVCLCLSGMVLLLLFTNPLTALLTFLSLVGYALIYTGYLKRATPQNIVIGGAAGAAPPVLGWTAVTGWPDADALLLFMIIFVWTPPHFWALAIHRREDYARADIPMLPVTHGVDYTRFQILLYTVLLIPVTVLPYLTELSGLVYLLGVLALDGIFVGYAWRLYRTRDDRLAMPTFGYSIIYLFALFALLMVDHYL